MSIGIDSIYLTAVLELLVVAVHAAVIGGVLFTRRRNLSATLAWILFIVFAPFVGVIICGLAMRRLGCAR